MKKIIPFLAMLIIFTSCIKNSSKETTPEESQPQKEQATEKRIDPMTELLSLFESFLYRSHGQNEILKNELYLERDKNIIELVDSFLVFKNLKGTISDFATHNSSHNNINIKYTITINFPKNSTCKLYLYCENIIDKQKLESNYLYNKIKNIPENSTVFFDGFFAINRTHKKAQDRIFSKSAIFNYPRYFFHVLDISSINELPDTLSSNLRKTMLLGQKECEHIVRKWQKKKTSSKDYEKIYAELKKLKGNLTLQELEYYERYTDAYTDDLVKSGR